MMMKIVILKPNKLFHSIFLASLIVNLANSANFNELFQPYWAPDHIVALEGEPIKLQLDNTSGCGFGSKNKYMFGQVSMDIKLVEGDSAGTVTAFYMSSGGPNHDELDLEFLGNVSGEPYLLQTNIYINGTGNREQRHALWFDPTTTFHTYSLLWNRHHIRFLVDNVPIRIFSHSNTSSSSIPYPNSQPMGVYASVWNADDWATQGGRVKTNWSNAPFVPEFRGFEIDGCVDVEGKCGVEGEFWWDGPEFRGLNMHQRRQLKWVRRRFLVYDYCGDVDRFSSVPIECAG